MARQRRARSTMGRLLAAATLATVGLVGAAAPVAAADPVVVDIPAGIACAGFDLRIEIVGGNQVFKEFFDKNGNLVRTISAGKGSALTFTNLSSGDSLSLRPNGSVSHISYHPDGSQTWMTNGHNVLILFPTDVPAGPSTTLTVGRTVFTVDTSGVFTVQSVSGRSTDICAAIS